MSEKALSTATKILCECCEHVKVCRLYVLQDGRAAWVCEECRNGKS